MGFSRVGVDESGDGTEAVAGAVCAGPADDAVIVGAALGVEDADAAGGAGSVDAVLGARRQRLNILSMHSSQRLGGYVAPLEATCLPTVLAAANGAACMAALLATSTGSS